MKLLLLAWVVLAIIVVGGIGFSAVQNGGPPDIRVLTVGSMLLAISGYALLRLDSEVRNL